MEKSYFSFVSVLFCLLKGHCFIPVYAKTKSYMETIKSINPDIVFICEDTLPTEFNGPTLSLEKILMAENKNTFQSDFVPAAVLPDQIAYIISTSGTTGRPKLIPISYRNFNSYVENITTKIQTTKKFRLIQNFEISFDPYLFDVVTVLYSHCRFLPLPHVDLRIFHQVVSRSPDDIWISLTPSQGDLLLTLNENKNWPEIKKTFFLGEKLKTELCKKWLRTFPNCEIYNMYGPAETTVSIFCHRFNPITDKTNFVPIGDIHPGHEFKIEDSGELFVKGPQVFNGYLESPSKLSDLTWFNTHDIVETIDEKLYIRGRSDQQIKINARRFQPEDMETFLATENISGLIIPVMVETKNLIKTHLVFVTQDKTVHLEHIIEVLKLKYDIDLLPKKLVYVEQYPLNQNGKTDRAKLADLVGVNFN